MIELAGGVQPASPMATPTRKISSHRKDAATPHKAVMIDQTMTQTAITMTRLLRSAHMAIGMPMSA